METSRHQQVLQEALFITPSKRDLQCQRRHSYPVDKSTGFRCDQTIILTGVNTAKDYPMPLRRIRHYDAETDNSLTFITNNFVLPSLIIAHLYKARWQVELSFEWNKAAPSNRSLLRDLFQRGEDTSLDSCVCLCAGSDSQKAAPSRPEPLHNPTVLECIEFRENTHFRGVPARVLQN